MVDGSDRGEWVERTWEPRLDAGGPRAARQACRYRAYVPAEVAGWQPRILVSTAGLFAEAEAALVEASVRAAGGGVELLSRLLLRTEAIASSRIEGLDVGARAFLRAENRLDAGRQVPRVQAAVIGNVEALQVALDSAFDAPVGLGTMIGVHRSLLESTDAGIAGVVRDTQNWIGGNAYNPCGADFVPPPPEELDRLLADLVSFMNRVDLSAGAQAAIAHVQFESLHPFADGNGRTGRALIQLLLRRGLDNADLIVPLSLAFAGSRDRYIEALTGFRRGDVDAYLSYFATALKTTADHTLTYLDRVDRIRTAWREQMSETRADSAVWKILDVLPGTPLITLPTAIAATGRSRGAVNQALGTLAHAGVLTATNTAPRQRTWEATEIFEALAELETNLS